jgi:hypothetical protein
LTHCLSETKIGEQQHCQIEEAVLQSHGMKDRDHFNTARTQLQAEVAKEKKTLDEQKQLQQFAEKQAKELAETLPRQMVLLIQQLFLPKDHENMRLVFKDLILSQEKDVTYQTIHKHTVYNVSARFYKDKQVVNLFNTANFECVEQGQRQFPSLLQTNMAAVIKKAWPY